MFNAHKITSIVFKAHILTYIGIPVTVSGGQVIVFQAHIQTLIGIPVTVVDARS